MKTKTVRTPGPWEESHMVAGFIVGADGDYVARTDFPHRMLKDDRSYSKNARLIAAAPDLLAALKSVKKCGMFHSSWAHITAPEESAARCGCPQCVEKKVEAAIAKAEGK